VTKSGSPDNPLVCPYCGLESAVPTKHGTAHECIAALEREVNHLREDLLRGQTSADLSEPLPARSRGRAIAAVRLQNVGPAERLSESDEAQLGPD